jgi:hypothetical protein
VGRRSRVNTILGLKILVDLEFLNKAGIDICPCYEEDIKQYVEPYKSIS